MTHRSPQLILRDLLTELRAADETTRQLPAVAAALALTEWDLDHALGPAKLDLSDTSNWEADWAAMNKVRKEGWSSTIDFDGLADWPKPEALMQNEMVALLYFHDLAGLRAKGGFVYLSINANDLFYPAADAEVIPLDFCDFLPLTAPIVTYYTAARADILAERAGQPQREVTRWLCARRGMRPWPHFEERMRAEGTWDDALDVYPARDARVEMGL